MAPLLEDQVKQLLGQAGIVTPRGRVVASTSELDDVIAGLGLPLVAKARIPIGKKGKAGAVRFCRTREDLTEALHGMIGHAFRGFTCSDVLIEEAVPIEQELFVSLTFDGLAKSPVLLLSALGGVDIEEVALANPESVAKIPVKSSVGVSTEAATGYWQQLGLDDAAAATAGEATSRIWQAFCASDGQMVEVNPLALDANGRAVAVGALFDVDDEALFRQPELAGWVEYGAGRAGRPPTPLERELFELNTKEKSGSIRFMELPDGEVGSLVFGGGCSMFSTDQMVDAGVRPATYYDATAPSPNMLRALFTGVLSMPGLKGLIFGANIINLFPIKERLQILVDVIRDLGIDLEAFPVVVRLAGTGQEEARELAASMPGLVYFADEVTVEYAIDHFLELVTEKDNAA
ncbi:MAG: ATP-grasp domain-containing protein [Dehalococcoidia bacterium]